MLTTPRLLAPMWLAFLINLTAYPASGGLLPYVARSVYHVDATGLGWLVASFSLGGLLASMTMVTTGGMAATRSAPRSSTPRCGTRCCSGFGHLQTLRPRLLRAARGRLRAERGDDLDDRHPDHRCGRALPRRG